MGSSGAMCKGVGCDRRSRPGIAPAGHGRSPHLSLVDRTGRTLHRLARSPHALWWLALASFAESLVVPIPLEVILIPFMAANRDRIWRTALAVTLACLAGATVGYYVGLLAMSTIGQDLIAAFGWGEHYETFSRRFAEGGFLALIAASVSPIPFQLSMLVAGAAEYPLLLFLLASGIARGIRYFGLALVVYLVGERALELWRTNKVLLGALALLVFAAVLAATVVMGR